MTATATRTGEIGNCYEYRADGTRLAGADRSTIDGMVALSAKWTETYHLYVSIDGYEAWAHQGQEVAEAALPASLRRK